MWKISSTFHGVFTCIFLCSDFFTGGIVPVIASYPSYDSTLTVTTILNPPYCQLKKSATKLSGNEQYEGYAIDLMDSICVMLGCNYTIYLAPGNVYGSLDTKTRTWSGMIGELIEERADIAIADLTITSERQTAVDFSMPFMNFGVSILYLKPERQPPGFFSFLSPFSIDVWFCILVAFLIVSVVLYLLSRFTQDKQKSEETFEQSETPFTLLNCMWFTIASLMQQRCVFLPRTISTRMVAVLWWIFVLIMVSSYTANLAAFLTVETVETPISSVEDLSHQSRIRYGVVNGGSTMAFFKNAASSPYQRMWSAMESFEPSVFTHNNEEGIKRVKNGKGYYAFLMETSSIEYTVARNCELTQIGGILNSRSYGIALRKNSAYRSLINTAILRLEEDGKLGALKQRWWRDKDGGDRCSYFDGSDSDAPELRIQNFHGVFVFLTIGLLVACIIGGCEFFWKYRKTHVKSAREMQQN